MQDHAVLGEQLLSHVPLVKGEGLRIIRSHHERWDGAGYPDGLAAEEIPVGARIVSVADSVEAMTSRQLYRKPLESGEIIAELQKHRGKQWDPAVVDIVLRLIASGELVLAQGGLRLLELGPFPEGE
jgi:HD-GYP domain-containing protein (c-di-GMP phosphodiesterase class II)